jgi:hypothetical protein
MAEDDQNQEAVQKPIVFIVEGIDDKLFLERFFEVSNINTDDIGIAFVGGQDKYKNFLSAFIKARSYTRGIVRGYAIIRDADDDAAAKMQAIHNELDQLKLPKPSAGAIIGQRDGRAVGVYLFPNNREPGDLEALCLKSVEGTPVHLRALAYFESVNTLATNPLTKITKRKAQSYLAGCEIDLCAGVGRGFRRGAFDHASGVFNELKEFLEYFVQISRAN